MIQPNHKMLRKLVGKKRPADPASAAMHADPQAEAAPAVVPKKRKKAVDDKPKVTEAPSDAPPKKKTKAVKKAPAQQQTSPVDPKQARRESFIKPGASSWRAGHKGAPKTAGHNGAGQAKRGMGGSGNASQPKKQINTAEGSKATGPKPNLDGFSRNQRKNFKKRAARRAKSAQQQAAPHL